MIPMATQRNMIVSERINGLIPAAGLSRRMGGFKPLLPLRGRTVIENTIDSMLTAGVDRVVVVLGYRGEELEALLREKYDPSRLVLVYNHCYAETDMLTSIKCGLAVMPTCDRFFLLPGDMPVITQETYEVVLRAATVRPSIVFPTLEGYRKHPPLIDSDFIPAILNYQGEDGLRGFWRLHEECVVTVPVDDVGCRTDLDTRQQYDQCIRAFEK